MVIKPEKRTRVLSPESLHILLRMAGEGHSPTDIWRYFEAENIPHPTRQAIDQLTRSAVHQITIKDYKEAFMGRVMDIPIANKRVRIDDLEKVRTRLIRTMENLINKEHRISDKKVSKYLSLAKRLKEIIDSARDEIEKKPLIQLNQTNITTLEELREHEKSINDRLLQLHAGGIRLSSEGEGEDSEIKKAS